MNNQAIIEISAVQLDNVLGGIGGAPPLVHPTRTQTPTPQTRVQAPLSGAVHVDHIEAPFHNVQAPRGPITMSYENPFFGKWSFSWGK